MRTLLAAVATLLLAAPASAVDVVIDYSYDTGGFFSTSTTNGQAARATIEYAADFLSEILDDSFSSIQTPSPYYSSAFNGVVTWDWNLTFNHPSNGTQVSLTNLSIAEDEYRVYVGARSLSGSTLGIGGPGGWGWGWGTGGNGGGFTSAEINEINAITADFSGAIEDRGEPTGEFANWGGSLTFDTGTNWNYDHTASPSGGQNDLLSVALHELTHAIGFGTSDEFSSLSAGTYFIGSESTAANGGANPRLDSGGGHWREGTSSTVFPGGATQETAMDPNILTGTRQLLTDLDVAALADIGWDIVEPVTPTLPGDYNGDLIVDAADYVVWRNSLDSGTTIGSLAEWKANYGSATPPATSTTIPEPATALLAGAAFAAGFGGRAAGFRVRQA